MEKRDWEVFRERRQIPFPFPPTISPTYRFPYFSGRLLFIIFGQAPRITSNRLHAPTRAEAPWREDAARSSAARTEAGSLSGARSRQPEEEA